MLASLRRAVARIRGFLRPGDGQDDFDEELRTHLEMATEDKIRQGLSPREARRRARVDLGNLTALREAGREVRGLPWLGRSWLDVKLGLRMLRKSWGLTLVAGLAMTVVIGLAAVAFDVGSTVLGTDLPLDEGERVVALQAWDLHVGSGLGTSAQQLELWRGKLRSVEDVGAFRTVERNLQIGTGASGGPAEAVVVAEVSAAGFRLARVGPVLGRPLVPDDEAAAADPVLVIGHEVWRSRFGADPEVLGRRVRLDGSEHTIVGVMPEGFGFPVFHRYWTPLRSAPSSYAPDAGADDLVVFARLGDGVTLQQAVAELRRFGRLEGAERPVTRGEVELRVVPYVAAFTGEGGGWMLQLALLVFMLLLIPPCINVAVLVYARTVTRQGEFAARYVLGASRSNIVAQLFVEILVLAAGAGLVALVVARVVVWQVLEDIRGRGNTVPFWMDFGLSPRTVIFVAGLAAFAALIAGAVPALQATGRRMQAGLKSLGRQNQAQLGGVWTALIVLQVAFAFALLPTSVEMAWGTLRSGLLGPGFAAEEYLTARLEMGADAANADAADADAADADAADRFETRRRELVRLLAEEPAVAAVSVAAAVPGEEPWERVELEDATDGAPADDGGKVLAVGTGRLARAAQVDHAFFDVFEVALLTGRAFDASDFEPGSHAVIVNRSFVDEVLGGGEPLGRRIRHRKLGADDAPAVDATVDATVDAREEPWLEIVGVVADLQRHSGAQTIYRPAVPGALASASLALRLRSDPTTAAGLLRELTWKLDPALRVSRIRNLDEIYRQKAVGDYLGASGLVVATLSVLLLSAAGIYALMAFTLGRRRQEIGIRLALGAGPWRLVGSVFGRALGQVGLGALVGVWIALLIGTYVPVEELGGWRVPGALPAATAVIVVVALLALLGPARRGLRVEPIEELREG